APRACRSATSRASAEPILSFVRATALNSAQVRRPSQCSLPRVSGATRSCDLLLSVSWIGDPEVDLARSPKLPSDAKPRDPRHRTRLAATIPPPSRHYASSGFEISTESRDGPLARPAQKETGRGKRPVSRTSRGDRLTPIGRTSHVHVAHATHTAH